MHILTRYLDGAAVRLQQTDEILQEHALAGAAAADYGQHLAVHDVEIHAAQHILSAEALAQPLNTDERRRGGHNSTVLRK